MRDYHIDWERRPRAQQVIVLEDSKYVVPGSKRLSSFYGHASKCIDLIATEKQPSLDRMWECVFHEWPFASRYAVDCIIGRQYWDENDPGPPDCPFAWQRTLDEVRPYYNVFTCYSVRSRFGLDLPDIEVLGKLSAVLGHAGAKFEVCDDGTSLSDNRCVPVFKKVLVPHEEYPLHVSDGVELILGGPNVSIPYSVPVNYIQWGNRGSTRMLHRKYPSVVFQDTEPLYLAYLTPVSEWVLKRDGTPWPVRYRDEVPEFDVSVFKDIIVEDQDLVKLFSRLTYDVRCGVGLGFWAMALPWENFAQLRTDAGEVLAGYSPNEYRPAFLCVTDHSRARVIGMVCRSALRCFYGPTSAIPDEGVTPFNMARCGLALKW